MDVEKWGAVKGILFAGLAVIAALVGGTVWFVFDQARRTHEAAIDRCHDAGGAWVASGERSYSGTCLRTPETPPWPPAKP